MEKACWIQSAQIFFLICLCTIVETICDKSAVTYITIYVNLWKRLENFMNFKNKHNFPWSEQGISSMVLHECIK